jgi:hypothetical protein
VAGKGDVSGAIGLVAQFLNERGRQVFETLIVHISVLPRADGHLALLGL